MQSATSTQSNPGSEPGTKCTIFFTTAVLKSGPSGTGNSDCWSTLRLVFGTKESITLEKAGTGKWEGKSNVEFKSGNLSLVNTSDPNKPEEVGHVVVGEEFKAQYIGPEKHQYRFDCGVVRINPGPTLNVSCEVSIMLPQGAQYPIEKRRQAAAVQNNPLVHSMFSMMGDAAAARFKESGDIVEADKAISAYSGALRYTPQDHPDLPGRCRNLGVALLRRFEHAGKLEDLKQAISAFRASIGATPNTGGLSIGFINLPDTYYHLGVALLSLCRYTGQVEPAAEAVRTLQKAVEISVILSHPSLPHHYGGLGNAFFVRFELNKDAHDLERAVEAFESGIKVTPKGDEGALAGLHNNLGNPFSMLFEQTGDVTYLHKCIDAYKQSIDLTPPSDPFLASRHGNLCRGLATRYKRTGKSEDIEDAIISGRKAVALTPAGHPELPAWVNLLASALSDRFDRTESIKDIDEAVSLHRRAVGLTPSDHSYFSFRNQDLGTALLARFNRTDELRDVEEAIAALQTAIDTCPSGHVYLANIYINLGNALSKRFNRTGEARFADQAIAAHRRAITLSSPSSASLPSFYNNLGTSLKMRFSRTGQREDLVQAIAAFRKAVEISPLGHDGLPKWCDNLANALISQSRNGGGFKDLVEALALYQKAIELTPTEGRNSFSQYNGLGILFHERFRHTNDERDLEGALKSYQISLDSVPKGHASRSGLHLNIAYTKMDKYKLTKGHNHLIDAVSHFELAARYSSGNPLYRFEAARQWAVTLVRMDDVSGGMAAFKVAIELLPLAAGLDQTVERRHSTLVDISDLSREAAAYAFRTGNSKVAVEWLEESRCLVWGQLNHLRTSIDDLRLQDRALAERFSAVARALETAGTRQGPYNPQSDEDLKTTIALQKEALVHVELAAEYESLVKSIRAKPGFQRFLKTPSFENLVHNIPRSGYVVIVNVEGNGCDAICLSRSGEPIHVPLSGFSYDKALELRTQLREVVNTSGLRMRGERVGGKGDGRALVPFKSTKSNGEPQGGSIPGILSDLWSLVVKPIVDALGLMPGESFRKRFWWCLTGPLAFLPIHAAGIYPSVADKNESLSDFVVSSYIPTLTSLVNRSTEPSSTAGTRSIRKFLLVSQAEVEGLCSLPGAAREVESVTQTLHLRSIPSVSLTQTTATVSATLAQIKSHTHVHLACHASQDLMNPLNSGFFLNDGKLTLSEIIKLGATNAELAYLSACQTSAGDERLSEEAVHLAAGMMAAGFRGVVATMWSIRDEDAPEVAADFYDYLLNPDNSGVVMDCSESGLAAYSLDYAVRRLRQKLGNSDSAFLAWLPYVHFGM